MTIRQRIVADLFAGFAVLFFAATSVWAPRVARQLLLELPLVQRVEQGGGG